MEKGFFKFFIDIWNYQIVSVDENPITFGTLLIGIVFLAVGFFISRTISRKVVHRLLKKTGIDKSYVHTLETLIFYLLVILFTLFAMKMANIPITIFTVIGGAFAIGIGFGSQNIVNNFISGLILMIERPIKVGDYIEVDNSYGHIDDIGTRSTTITTPGNRQLIVPNSFFLDKKVINYTHHDRIMRGSVKVGVAYGSQTRLVETLLLKACEDEPRIMKGREPFVWFQDFGDSALIFELFYWVRQTQLVDRFQIESNLRYRINDLFAEKQVVISFPQRDVHFYPHGKIQVQLQSPER